MTDRLFDTHCHLFERGFSGSTGVLLRGRHAELHAYERYRSEFAIERSLVLGFEGEAGYLGSNAYLESLSVGRPWLIPVPFVAVGSPLSGRAACAYVSTADDGQWLAAELGRRDAPALLSLNARPEALAAAAPALRAAGGTWILVSHLGLPGPAPSLLAAIERLEPLLSLAAADHVTVKLSGQYAASSLGYPHPDVQPIVDLVADRFGGHRLTWGSDFSPCLEHVTFAEAVDCVLPSGASPTERDAILFSTADRLYHHYLGVPA